MRRGLGAAAAVVLLLGAVVALGLGAAGPAAAHTGLVSSSPADGEVLAALPDRVTLVFGAPMTTPAYVAVVGPDGNRVTSGDPVVDGTTVEQALGQGGDGAYTLAFRVLTDDGHWVTGQLSFTVGAAPAATTGPATTAAPVTAAPSADTGRKPPSETDAQEFWSRRVVHVGVSVLLFGAATALLVASRRPLGEDAGQRK